MLSFRVGQRPSAAEFLSLWSDCSGQLMEAEARRGKTTEAPAAAAPTPRRAQRAGADPGGRRRPHVEASDPYPAGPVATQPKNRGDARRQGTRPDRVG